MADEALMNELLQAGVHYGHQTRRWNPRMKPYIYGKRSSIYVIDLEKTAEQIEEARQYLADIVSNGGKILFVGCKRQAQEAVKEAAEACGQFYVNERWLGGTLTNLSTIRKSVARMEAIEDLQASPDFKKLPKKEIAALNRELAKLHRNLNGVRKMDKYPDVLVIIDTTREHIAVNEAKRLNINTCAIVDTNSDPEVIDYPIAGNDDAIRSIRVILQKLVDAILTAQEGTGFVPSGDESAFTPMAGENTATASMAGKRVEPKPLEVAEEVTQDEQEPVEAEASETEVTPDPTTASETKAQDDAGITEKKAAEAETKEPAKETSQS